MTRILVAEDDPNIARLVAFKLGKEGHEVRIAGDGREALSLLLEEPWSLAILDVMMPHHDGWEVLKRLRATPGLERLPVLMLTAKNLGRDLAHAAELGANRVLRKPFVPAELVLAVRELTVTGEGSP